MITTWLKSSALTALIAIIAITCATMRTSAAAISSGERSTASRERRPKLTALARSGSLPTALPTASLYRRYVRWAARSVAGALDASGSDARVLMGVPTYEPFGFMHRRGVETPENALMGVVAGLRGLGAGGTFEGVALYAEWTTDEADWAAYERHWRNRPE